VNTDLSMGNGRATRRPQYLIVVLIIVSLILGYLLIQQNKKVDAGKELSQQNAEVDKNKTISNQGEKLTVWNIIKMTDWLFWPFVLITAVGILLIIYHALVEHQDKTRAQHLLQLKIETSDIRSLVRDIKVSNLNRASRLMQQMITTFSKTNRAEPIGDDINQFVHAERDSFETFTRVTGFLSESAGALGLLGTVWGIFLTFHAGKLDGPTILQGMSISLVTTLVGLIISILLNMGATYVFTLFNRQLRLITTRAEELRQVLLYLEKNQGPKKQKEYREKIPVPEYEYSS